MTEQEAIKHLKEITGWANFWGGCYKEKLSAIDMALNALEKQIPMKPIKHMANPVGFPYYECPVCGDYDVSGQKYCDECGQKLDRGEQNG